MSMLDNETLLPEAPWSVLNRRWYHITYYLQTYQEKYEYFQQENATFEEFSGDGYSSVEQLIARGNDPAFSPEERDLWTNPDTYGSWFPQGRVFWMEYWNRIWIEAFGYQIERSRETWIAGIHTVALFGSDQAKFMLGMIIRVTIRLWQIKAAMMLEQVLCQGYRGRSPVGAL